MISAALIGLSLIAAPHASLADEDGDHDRARDLFEHGEIRSLPEILGMVAVSTPGDIVAIDLVRVGDKWIYMFQVVTPDGHLVQVNVDAAHGVVLDPGGEPK